MSFFHDMEVVFFNKSCSLKIPSSFNKFWVQQRGRKKIIKMKEKKFINSFQIFEFWKIRWVEIVEIEKKNSIFLSNFYLNSFALFHQILHLQFFKFFAHCETEKWALSFKKKKSTSKQKFLKEKNILLPLKKK